MGEITEKTDVKVSMLKPYENNAKKHSKAQIEKIAKSIQEYGFLSPCLIDRDYNIIAGHGRVMAVQALGWDTVPCVFVEGLTDEQRRAYILADNKLGELADWDDDLVAEELAALDEAGFDIELTGFDYKDMMPATLDAEEDNYKIELPEEPRAKEGDIYQLGRHRLMCGDATDPDAVKALVDGQAADLFLTDPPYGINYTGKTKDALKIENDEMNDEDFRAFLANAFLAAKSVLKDGASFYIWHAIMKSYAFWGAVQDMGWQVRECLIWKKNTMVLGRQDYQWQHEPCLYGWNENKIYYEPDHEPCLYGWQEGASHSWYADRKQTTVLEFDKPPRNAKHPTMKPVKLFDYLMKNSTKEGDLVLDTFAGSGTTAIAAEQNGRNAYMMELDPKYVDVIIDRWEEYTGEKAVKIL